MQNAEFAHFAFCDFPRLLRGLPTTPFRVVRGQATRVQRGLLLYVGGPTSDAVKEESMRKCGRVGDLVGFSP
jgi:hypothetical protein